MSCDKADDQHLFLIAILTSNRCKVHFLFPFVSLQNYNDGSCSNVLLLSAFFVFTGVFPHCNQT